MIYNDLSLVLFAPALISSNSLFLKPDSRPFSGITALYEQPKTNH